MKKSKKRSRSPRKSKSRKSRSPRKSRKSRQRVVGKTGAEETKFRKVLESAKEALDSIKVPFHLHSGTALGAHREKSFIKHDHDIDVSVFYKDVNTPSKVAKLRRAMEDHGFEITGQLGKLSRGKEIQFWKDGVPLDIFWTYEGQYRGKKYYIVSSYYGECDKLKYNTCVWGYRPYKVRKINFLGKRYDVVPEKTLIDMYGKDWDVPKKFGYHEGITEGGYKGFLRDYHAPKDVSKKVAFCFLLYDKVVHKDIWEKFFNGDAYPVKSYNIYSHVKNVTSETSEWIKKAKVRTVNTEWCHLGLVRAWVMMLRKALKEKTNKYFVLLSGECIPLYDFSTTHKKILQSKKSRIEIWGKRYSEEDGKAGYYSASQWLLLTRKHAEALVDLIDSQSGKTFVRKFDKRICYEEHCDCPDEIYPVNWFIHKYGAPSTKRFKENFRNMYTTYTYWKEGSGEPHPVKFNENQARRKKREICDSGALFARKFNKSAAKVVAMNC